MTEAEWLASDEPVELMRLAPSEQPSQRKVRLFVVACCQRFLRLPTAERNRAAVETAERFADGKADIHEMLKARGQIGSSHLSAVLAHSASILVWHAAEWAVRGCTLVPDAQGERIVQASLLRDIFGNPFRSVDFDPGWRTSTVVAIARGMYESRDFSAMPILADALQDAGCQVADILDHCQNEKVPHVRGCWVVDLVLGKE